MSNSVVGMMQVQGAGCVCVWVQANLLDFDLVYWVDGVGSSGLFTMVSVHTLSRGKGPGAQVTG